MKIHGNAKDITGYSFGRLSVLRVSRRIRSSVRPGTRLTWLCLCACGNECEVVTAQLLTGRTKSCGCFKRDQMSMKPRAAGAKHPPQIRSAADSPFITGAEKIISEYPLYTVTADGDVYSYRGYRRAPRKKLAVTWQIAKNGAGYAYISLFVDGRPKRCAVHRLVAMAFLSPPADPAAVVVRHLDGNSRNNHLGNLAWGTHKDNAADKRLHNRNLERGRHPMAKLDDAKVEAARAAHRAGYTYKQIAEFLGVGATTIGAIIRNEHWKEPHLLGVNIEDLKREAQREAA